MMMASGASRTEAARNPHPTSQEEVLFDWGLLLGVAGRTAAISSGNELLKPPSPWISTLSPFVGPVIRV
ncbi:hypothetical protein BHM03_00029452 [Ensete ventricosum]|nr:hypothetical protein BHM03_00029452 [Ensete ventricosum]